MRRGGLAAAVAAGIGGELCAVGLIASAAFLIARASEHPPLSVLALAIVGVRGFALFRGTLRYAERLAGHDVALRMLAGLRVRAYEALRRAPTGRDARDADLVQRLVADVESVQDLVLRCVLPAAVAWAVGIAATVLGFVLLPVAGVVLAGGVLVAGVVLPFVAALASRAAAGRVAGARADLAVRAHDVAEGAADLAAFGATRRFVARADEASGRLERLERRAATVGAAVSGLGSAIQGLTALAVLWTARGQGAGGVLVTVLSLTALIAVESVLPVAEAARRFVELRPSARRVGEILATPTADPAGQAATRPGSTAPAGPPVEPPRRDPARSRSGESRTARAAEPCGRAVPARPDITLAGVGVAYGGAVALDGVDLDIPYGRKVAVVGASGAGKSTLLAVLSGEVRATGTVLLGGAPQRAYDPAGVRAAVRGLTHDAHVFAASIRANVALARPDASAEELQDAAGRAGILDWIRSLPGGWDTPAGDGRLSGGQRQRLLIARALLAGPPVLILDEPAEGLDLMTGDRLVSDLLGGERTVVLVTHRLAPLAAADEVVVLDRGRVVQRGPHDALVLRAGPYRDLWAAERLQAGRLTVTPSA